MLYNNLKTKIETIEELEDLGMIPKTLLRNMKLFEYYLSLPKDLCNYCKYELVADVFELSSDRAKNIILKLRS
ncbi:hypothetical protein J2Q11_08660 [Tenacibaculum finnmarkense genomovar finnmarkense]|uniref:hypothetical protein n=1 Tax=Tenacibaculum finnmarkense TaxID=2781243 RepID=UPI001EFA5FF3|nr:hypothetical protein [Tenacibaculum finnmarkense]MCG8212932.1 hypothetical protein [Tenacibaculum finnmarkense genomovar finnmarkense]MCG8231197.1 hypothetical protein [Tenacibaculum finnmarkense genomovar finnmarkense]MCG8884588.1 hypothetical protein [Tenacibaculum finnmarkense]MCG8897168.1 hypothetical protein [Tenacibaculum finnmarkense]MCG8903225.1 hypothetical protein [Tenacibaculum finnmarkense]